MFNSTLKNIVVSFIDEGSHKTTDIPQYTDTFYNLTHERESIHEMKSRVGDIYTLHR